MCWIALADVVGWNMRTFLNLVKVRKREKGKVKCLKCGKSKGGKVMGG